MQIERIACNSCGAPLEVSATTNYVTCRHCGMKLSIQRTNTATFTEILDQLTVKTDQLSEQVNNIAGYTELAALDREWELERQNYMVTTKHAGKHIRHRRYRFQHLFLQQSRRLSSSTAALPRASS